jgi:hypothetical protein
VHVLEAEDSAYLFCVRSGVMARNRPVDLARAFSHAGEKGGLAQVSTHTAAIVRVPCTSSYSRKHKWTSHERQCCAEESLPDPSIRQCDESTLSPGKSQSEDQEDQRRVK